MVLRLGFRLGIRSSFFRGFLPEIPVFILRYYNTVFLLCHHRGRRCVSVSETALQQLVDALRVAALVERKFAQRASPRAGHGASAS